MTTATTSLVALLTAVGENQPGLVARIAEFLSQHGANVETSYGAQLGNLYGLFTLFSASPAAMEAITRECRTGKLRKYSATVHHADDVMPEAANYELTLYAFDSNGIVTQTSKILADHNVDILGMGGKSCAAPECGGRLFVLEMKLHVPLNTYYKLRSALNSLLDRNGWDLDLRALHTTDDHEPKGTVVAFPQQSDAVAS